MFLDSLNIHVKFLYRGKYYTKAIYETFKNKKCVQEFEESTEMCVCYDSENNVVFIPAKTHVAYFRKIMDLRPGDKFKYADSDTVYTLILHSDTTTKILAFDPIENKAYSCNSNDVVISLS
jgi:hypothetical protein